MKSYPHSFTENALEFTARFSEQRCGVEVPWALFIDSVIIPDALLWNCNGEYDEIEPTCSRTHLGTHSANCERAHRTRSDPSFIVSQARVFGATVLYED